MPRRAFRRGAFDVGARLTNAGYSVIPDETKLERAIAMAEQVRKHAS
jgi:hypothetical protein